MESGLVLLEMVSGRSGVYGQVLCFIEKLQSELEFVMLLGFSGYTDKIIKVISLH